jgi:hypothetical protein
VSHAPNANVDALGLRDADAFAVETDTDADSADPFAGTSAPLESPVYMRLRRAGLRRAGGFARGMVDAVRRGAGRALRRRVHPARGRPATVPVPVRPVRSEGRAVNRGDWTKVLPVLRSAWWSTTGVTRCPGPSSTLTGPWCASPVLPASRGGHTASRCTPLPRTSGGSYGPSPSSTPSANEASPPHNPAPAPPTPFGQ